MTVATILPALHDEPLGRAHAHLEFRLAILLDLEAAAGGVVAVKDGDGVVAQRDAGASGTSAEMPPKASTFLRWR